MSIMTVSGKSADITWCEGADELTVEFVDMKGEPYKLCLSVRYSEILKGDNLEVDLYYPDGGSIGLESIWLNKRGEES